jgi:hypothetical protein
VRGLGLCATIARMGMARPAFLWFVTVVLVAPPARAQTTDDSSLPLAPMRVPSLVPPPVPSSATLAARERPRVHFEFSGSIGVSISEYLFTAAPGIMLGLGAQLTDRWALSVRAALHAMNAHGALFVEHQLGASIVSLGFGAGAQIAYAFGGPPCGGCVVPWELSVIAPLELVLDPTTPRSTRDISRRGLRIAFQSGPTVAIRGQSNNRDPSPVGAYFGLRVGGAWR